MNGSSAIGHCSTIIADTGTQTCLDPPSSVLFDGNIPILTGLDGNMWASQLLTIRSRNFEDFPLLNFDFTNSVGVRRVEMVLFNCPEWGISVQSIALLVNGSFSFAGIVIPTVTSCDSLVRVCMGDLNINGRALTFILGIVNWVHIAEVTFYESSPTCPPETIITMPTPPPDTTPGTYNICI